MCELWAARFQNSVFECQVDSTNTVRLKLFWNLSLIKKKIVLRFYNLGDQYKNKVDHIGAKESYDVTETLIF